MRQNIIEGSRKRPVILTGSLAPCQLLSGPTLSSLQALVPVTIEVEVPFDLHRYIIGQKGSGIRKMMDEFEVLGFAVFPQEPVLGASPPTGPWQLSPSAVRLILVVPRSSAPSPVLVRDPRLYQICVPCR